MKVRNVAQWLAMLMSISFGAGPALSEAATFDVSQPDIERGVLEIETINGVTPHKTAPGVQTSTHEFGVSYGLSDTWKVKTGITLNNPHGDYAGVDALLFETVFLLPEPRSGQKDGFSSRLGFLAAFEIPREGGVGEGVAKVGPVWSGTVGRVELAGNAYIEIPFAEDSDPGLQFAARAKVPVEQSLSIGLEAFAHMDGALGDLEFEKYYVGPALFFKAEHPGGGEFAPRVALLFGLNNQSVDVILSVNMGLGLKLR